MKEKKILFILDYFYPHIGGLEIKFQNDIKHLKNQGYKIGVLTTKHKKELQKYENIEDVEVFRVGSSRINFMLYGFFKGLKLSKNYDIIHTTTFTAALPASLIGKIKGKKVYLTVHEIYGKIWQWYKGKFIGWFYMIFEKLIFSLPFDKYICVSTYTQNSIRTNYGIKDYKIEKKYNQIDHSFWKPENINNQEVEEVQKKHNLQDKFVGLYYGHPGPQKGVNYLLEAIPKIKEKIPNFIQILILTTDDKKLKKIKEKTDLLGIKENLIIIEGGLPREKLINYIGASSFVVMPSITEGFGLVSAEVCALNKNLVVSEIGALPEIAKGNNVFFIQPGSSQEIVDGVKRVYESF